MTDIAVPVCTHGKTGPHEAGYGPKSAWRCPGPVGPPEHLPGDPPSRGQRTPSEIVLDGAQLDAAAALAQGRTQSEAADEAGVTTRTIRRWLQLDEFQAVLREAEGTYRQALMRKLRHAGGRALDHLLDVMDDDEAEPPERRQAATAILRTWIGQDGTTSIDLGGTATLRYVIEGVDTEALT